MDQLSDDSEHKKHINDQSYFYLGYVITSDDELAAFLEVYKARIVQGLPFDTDLPAPPGRGSMGSNTFYRVRNGVESELTPETSEPGKARAESKIPIMWDRTALGPDGLRSNHGGKLHWWSSPRPNGINILFMDGHVEWVKFPGRFPATPKAAALLAEMDALSR